MPFNFDAIQLVLSAENPVSSVKFSQEDVDHADLLHVSGCMCIVSSKNVLGSTTQFQAYGAISSPHSLFAEIVTSTDNFTALRIHPLFQI